MTPEALSSTGIHYRTTASPAANESGDFSRNGIAQSLANASSPGSFHKGAVGLSTYFAAVLATPPSVVDVLV